MMRFMMMVRANQDTEAGIPPSPELIEAFMRYNEELARAGVLLAADGLAPSSSGIRIAFPEPGGKPKVIDGPFTEAKELIAGFTLIEVKSREEAIEWAMRMPDPHGFGEGVIELRQVMGAADITDDEEALAKDAAVREIVARQKQS